MCYGNLRGIKEAGKAFALPTYLFTVAVILMIAVGLVKEVMGNLHPQDVHNITGQPAVSIGSGAQGVALFAVIFTLLRSFANGGSSLTGIEAVSNAVSALRPPEGRNARQILVIQGSIVAFLIAGISWLAHATHTVPYQSGYPTVLAQEAKLIFGHTVLGWVLFYAVQAGTALILFTGGNTSFSGFPFLASFVAEDSFLPRWLTKRGHRLVFSGGIIVLTVVSLTLLIVVGAVVNNLIPFYAIGVFTGFTMAGFGMARYHRRNRGPGWRRHAVISVVGGIYTGLVVLIFAVVKFTEGAWLVVVVFPLLVVAFIRLNREYRMESRVLQRIGTRSKPPEPPTYARRTVYVFVDAFDLATIAALRYARSLRPTALHAVHLVIDRQHADALRQDWVRANTGITLDLVDTPDRRLDRAAAKLAREEAALPGVGVTVVLPRRSFTPLLGRLLHDHTADKIAAAVSQIPHAAATIVPFDVRGRLEKLSQRNGQLTEEPEPLVKDHRRGRGTPAPAMADRTPATQPPPGDAAPPPSAAPAPGTAGASRGSATSQLARPIASLTRGARATVEGRVRSIEIRPAEQNTILAYEIEDPTGQLTALFYGRSHIAGVYCGSRLRISGRIGTEHGRPVMTNPAYQLLADGEPP